MYMIDLIISQSYPSEYFALFHSAVKASSLSGTEGNYEMFFKELTFWKGGREENNWSTISNTIVELYTEYVFVIIVFCH